MSKKIVILFRIVSILLLLLIILLIASFFLIQSPKVQTKLVHYYTAKLSKDWNTEVQIGTVEVDFFKSIKINNIYVEDIQGDTLFYASKLETKTPIFQPLGRKFSLNNSVFNDVKIRLKRGENDSLYNVNYLLNGVSNDHEKSIKKEKKSISFKLKDVTFTNLDLLVEDSLKYKITSLKTDLLKTDFSKFQPENKKITAKYLTANRPEIALINMDRYDYDYREDDKFVLPKDWEFKVNKIDIIDGEFIKRGKPKREGKQNVFAFNNYHWDPFDLEAENLVAKDNQLDIVIKSMSFEDETGFKADNVKANGFINQDDVQLNNLYVKLDQSILDGDIILTYREFSNFKDFEEKIRLKTRVNKIHLMPREFQLLFGTDILKEAITISGDLEGTINNLKSKNFNMVYQNGTVVRGNIDARGLPVLGDTFFDAEVDELSITQYGLQEILGKQPVPEQVKKFGSMSFKGDFVGYITDLIAFGDLSTEIGDFFIDMEYSDSKATQPTYSGYLSTDDFQLGYWLGNPDLDRIAFSGAVSGRNFDLNTMSTSIDANIDRVDYQGKTINNVDLLANLDKQVLEYDAAINDELFEGIVKGVLDYSQPVAKNYIEADVKDGDLYAIGFSDSPLDVSGEFAAELTGNSIEELQGTIDAKDAIVVSNGKPYVLGDLGLEILKKNGKQNVGLVSENASVKFIGDYNYTQLFPTVQKVLNEYYDFNQGWENLENTVQTNEEIGFEVEIDPNNELIKLLLPEVQIDSGVNASGLLNPVSNEISILALADSLSYQTYSITNWMLDAYGDGETLYINSFQDDISNNGKRWLTDSELNVELSREDILMDVRTYNENFLSAKLSSRIKRNNDEFKVSILSSDLIINGEEWQIAENNSITLGGGTWKAENFTLKNGEQQVQIYNPPNQENTKLIANVDKLSVSDINSLIGFTKKPFEGEINGDINLIEYSDGLNLDVSLIVNDLLYNNDLVDITTVEGIYNLDSKLGTFEGFTNDDEFQYVSSANLDLNRQQDILDMDIEIVKSSLSPLENIWANSVENFDGFVAGDMKIIGGPELFRLDGNIEVVEDLAFTLKFTQSRYTIPVGEQLDIVEDGFVMNNMLVQDPFGSIAKLNGKIIHDDLRDYYLDIYGQYENFLFLNTTNRNNEVFYGKAFGTGDIRFSGPVNDALMLVNATSEPNTQIFIESTSSGNTGEYQFIRFRQPELDSTDIVLESENRSKLTMQFDLDILPNAEVNMNFDTEGYNSLRGNGYGDMRINMDTEELLEINGIYEVNQGVYEVNFRDIFERDFKLLPGGIIQWAGDPVNARIDINAQYQLEADVTALSSDVNSARFLNDATTDLNVNIFGSISEPQFNYNIQVDRAQVGSEINDQINIINQDQTQLDNQIGSLLLLGQFANINSDPFSAQRGEFSSLAFRSVTNILTKQISGLLSESGILENTTFNLDYDNYRDLAQQGGLADLPYDQQLQIQLSSRFLNDRVKVEYGGDFNFGDGLDENINAFEVGDFVLTYDLSESGNYKFKLFSLRDFSIIQQQEDRRNGFGFVIEKEFNDLQEAFEKEQKPEEEKEELPREFQPALEPENVDPKDELEE